MKRIGIATTGGDAPGMNTAIRAVTRLAQEENWQVIGFKQGWDGFVNNDFVYLTNRSVGGILQLGGTILQTSRSDALRSPTGKEKIKSVVREHQLNALVVIGGNGSMKAAEVFNSLTSVPVFGIPASIDNDVFGSDETIGFDSAVNTAVSQIDKIRDTATSLNRVFVVEVMGRKHGFIALTVGVSVGAEVIILPEDPVSNQEVLNRLNRSEARGKKSGIIVTAEGSGDSRLLVDYLTENSSSSVRLSVLGYSQRGGSPTARSRFLANQFSKAAIDAIKADLKNSVMVLDDGGIHPLEIGIVNRNEKRIDKDLLELNRVLTH